MKTDNAMTFISYRAGPVLYSLLCTAALVIACLSPGSVHATDRKSFSGTVCKSYWGYNGNDDLRYYTSGIMNPSLSKSIFVTCPIDRDNTTNTNGTYRVNVSYYKGDSDGSRLYCMLFSKDYYGSTIATSYNENASGLARYGNGSFMLDVDKSESYGTYVIYCKLPPQSMIKTIHVIEH